MPIGRLSGHFFFGAVNSHQTSPGSSG